MILTRRLHAGLLLHCVAEFRAMSEHPDSPPDDPRPEPELPEAQGGAGRESDVAETAKRDTPKEIGGRDGPEPVRYGDWEKNGRCIDF